MTVLKSIFYRLMAALMFFTRLPLWRWVVVPKECFERVVPLWPLAGWLTGGVMALTYALASLVLPAGVCVVLALTARVLLTGALHEDGFADFCDGFGGGRDRESTLRIMKDSHIGTYGVLGLVLYYLLLTQVLGAVADCVQTVDALSVSALLVSADAFAKWASSNVVNVLPYARTAEGAKNKLVYARMTTTERIVGFVAGVLPAVLLLPWPFVGAMLASAAAAMLLMVAMQRRLRGYTGDCCGACFVVSETVFHVASLLLLVCF